MTDSDPVFDHYSEQLRLLIWSGFFDRADYQAYLDDLTYDEEAVPCLNRLRKYGEAEFARKSEAEKDWPERTSWDRLDDAFQALNRGGILALHNAGYTSSDAHSDAWQIIRDDAPDSWSGFCFYHGQDVERAVDGMPLFIGFDAVAEGEDAKRIIGNRIAETLKGSGFAVDWNGDPETRMSITNLEWKKRTVDVSPDPMTDPNETEAGEPPRKPGLLARLFGKTS